MTALEAIQVIVDGKRSRGAFPEVALSIEVSRLTGMALREVEKEAEDLKSEGLIRIGKTLNYSYYELTKENRYGNRNDKI